MPFMIFGHDYYNQKRMMLPKNVCIYVHCYHLERLTEKKFFAMKVKMDEVLLLLRRKKHKPSYFKREMYYFILNCQKKTYHEHKCDTPCENNNTIVSVQMHHPSLYH